MNKSKKSIMIFVTCCFLALFYTACGVTEKGTGISSLLEEKEPVLSLDLSGEAKTPGEDVLSDTGAAEWEENAVVYVYICGEVISPGVYEVAADSRIYEVVMLAGGFTEEAVTEAVNLALPVSDGMQVIIPSLSEWEEADKQAQREKEGLVNINTATADKLCELPGIGASRAADIIAYREVQGGFSSTEEIMQVTGIKEAMYEKLKDYIYVE